MKKRYTLDEYVGIINDTLKSIIPQSDGDIVSAAMDYSLQNGGKRIRPALTLEFCRICGGEISDALMFACAVEMIHTYSLIHDDLPCMDNDDMRRGKPSCHIKYGEEYALLAGDGLLTLAFETLMKSTCGDSKKVKACSLLASAAGCKGMIGGQMLDLLNESRAADSDMLRRTDSLKTGALINVACALGCIAAGASDEAFAAAEKYAGGIGLAFQIVDDILDITSDSETLGKPVGSDEENCKSTYVSLFGLEKSKELAGELTEEAVDALAIFGDEAEFLSSLAKKLSVRIK